MEGWSHLGDFAKKLCRRHVVWAGALSWWSCQSPVAHSCGLLNHLSSFHGGMFKLNAKFDPDLLLCSLSHFECAGYTAYMLTQWCLPPPLTSTVKPSLLIHSHSSPLSLEIRLHWCQANHSCYVTIVGLSPARPCIYNSLYSQFFEEALCIFISFNHVNFFLIMIKFGLKSVSSNSSVISVALSINFLFSYSVWDIPDSWCDDWFSVEAWTFVYCY